MGFLFKSNNSFYKILVWLHLFLFTARHMSSRWKGVHLLKFALWTKECSDHWPRTWALWSRGLVWEGSLRVGAVFCWLYFLVCVIDVGARPWCLWVGDTDAPSVSSAVSAAALRSPFLLLCSIWSPSSGLGISLSRNLWWEPVFACLNMSVTTRSKDALSG